MDAEEKRKKFEWDILNIIEQKLQNGQMDTDRARAIARMILRKLHPPLTLEQLYDRASTLDRYFTELSPAVATLVSEREDRLRETVSQHAEKLIKQGRIGESLAMLKEATTKKL